MSYQGAPPISFSGQKDIHTNAMARMCVVLFAFFLCLCLIWSVCFLNVCSYSSELQNVLMSVHRAEEQYWFISFTNFHLESHRAADTPFTGCYSITELTYSIEIDNHSHLCVTNESILHFTVSCGRLNNFSWPEHFNPNPSSCEATVCVLIMCFHAILHLLCLREAIEYSIKQSYSYCYWWSVYCWYILLLFYQPGLISPVIITTVILCYIFTLVIV